MTSLTAEYDFETFTAMLILADYDFEDFYVTDWSRIDTDDPILIHFITMVMLVVTQKNSDFHQLTMVHFNGQLDTSKLNTILLQTALLNGKYQMQMA